MEYKLRQNSLIWFKGKAHWITYPASSHLKKNQIDFIGGGSNTWCKSIWYSNVIDCYVYCKLNYVMDNDQTNDSTCEIW